MDDWEELKEKYEHRGKWTRKFWYVVSAVVVAIVVLAVLFMMGYLNIGGLPQAAPASLEIIDATCNFVRGEYYVSVRNVGEYGPVATDGIVVSLDGVTISSSMSWDNSSIQVGGFATVTLSGHDIETGEVHVIKVTGPDGRTETENTIC